MNLKPDLSEMPVEQAKKILAVFKNLNEKSAAIKPQRGSIYKNISSVFALKKRLDNAAFKILDTLALVYAKTNSPEVENLLSEEIDLSLNVLLKTSIFLKNAFIPSTKDCLEEMHNALYIFSLINDDSSFDKTFVDDFDPHKIAVSLSVTKKSLGLLTPHGQAILKHLNKKFGVSNAEKTFSAIQDHKTLAAAHINARPCPKTGKKPLTLEVS